MLARTVAAMLLMACTLGAAPLSGRITIGGGRHLCLECHGSGSPTVVLDAGHRGRGDSWNVSDDPAQPKATPVLAGVQQFTRVCTYDRPGTVVGLAPKDFSRSDPVPMPQNAAAGVTDLHELLNAAKVPGPYVLVGHSFGGLNILLYALNYPRSVAGIVFVDALPPELRNQMAPSLWKTYSELIPQPVPGLHYKDLETMDFRVSIDQVQRALAQTTLPAIPIVVLTKDKPFDLMWLRGVVPAGFGEKLDAAWRRAQQQLAARLPTYRSRSSRRRITSRSNGHYRRDPPRRRSRLEGPQDGNSLARSTAARSVPRDMSMHGLSRACSE